MPNDESLPAYTRQFWAKSDRQDSRRVHLLQHHLADVGACFEALLQQPTIRQRLARTAGLEDLDEATIARLCVLATLHDIGKVNVGFQTRIWNPTDLLGLQRPLRSGHVQDLVPVLLGASRQYQDIGEWFFKGLHLDEMLGWDDRGGETVCSLFTATISHHGAPLDLQERVGENPANWQCFGDLSPQRVVENIGSAVRDWFPQAFVANNQALPSSPAFQHMFLGLCTLADWIGSDEYFFKFQGQADSDYVNSARAIAEHAVAEIGLDISQQRRAFPGQLPNFGLLFDIDEPPNAIQRGAQDVALEEPLVIIESETGSGKTEAALWRFAEMYRKGLVDGIYFALPTRAAASQIHRRITRFSSQLFPTGYSPEPVLAVPGYLRAGESKGKQLPNYQVWWDDHVHDETSRRRWAAEGAKRYLAAQIAVGTVDQAMMAALKVKHAHMRGACLARNLLVIDEVHASDTYMSAIIEALLDAHINAGGYAILMSATLGAAARRRWMSRSSSFPSGEVQSLQDEIDTPYPAISFGSPLDPTTRRVGANDQEKTVLIEALPAMADLATVVERGLAAARAGAKVLIIRNTVTFAINTQRELEERAGASHQQFLFKCRGVPCLHHSRFATEDRRLLDSAVEDQIGKHRDPGGLVVVGTQTLEQSLDIDADLLITDLCPMDVLLQRIGRLHRHGRDHRPAGYETPTCIVLTPPGDDLSPLLTRSQNSNGLGPRGYVYEDLRILEATRRLVVQYSASGGPWRIPEMNRELVERATHPTALECISQELGDAWVTHGRDISGEKLADNLTARQVIVRRDKSFFEDNRDVRFGTLEERIRTRLGDEGIELELTPPLPSPFNREQQISRITLPNHLLRGSAVAESAETLQTADGFEFTVGEARFLYDRLGLRRV